MKVLVLEDEKKLATFVKCALSEAGMLVDVVMSLSECEACIKTSRYDVLVLDRLIKDDDAISFIPLVKQNLPDIKIIILSALSKLDSRVEGLTSGADDYLGKPFHVSELVARVKALSRRGSSKGNAFDIVYKDLTLDLEKQKAYRSTKEIELTKKEFLILSLLAKRPQVVFSRSQILDEAWDFNHYPESNIVEVTISKLRKKIDQNFPQLIQSKRGVGYWLE